MTLLYGYMIGYDLSRKGILMEQQVSLVSLWIIGLGLYVFVESWHAYVYVFSWRCITKFMQHLMDWHGMAFMWCHSRQLWPVQFQKHLMGILNIIYTLLFAFFFHLHLLQKILTTVQKICVQITAWASVPFRLFFDVLNFTALHLPRVKTEKITYLARVLIGF